MSKTVALIGLLVCPITAIFAEREINDYIKRSKAARKELLADMQTKLPKLRNDLKAASRRDLSRVTPEPRRYLDNLKDNVAQAERTISKLSNPWQPYCIPLERGSTKVGDIGEIDGWFERHEAMLKTVQVIDTNNMLAELNVHGNPGRTLRDDTGTFRVGATRTKSYAERMP